jgi:hypothetical protein
MTPQERIKDLVLALNDFVGAGNEDVPEKMQKEFTKLMQTAHTLSFASVDVSTRMDAVAADNSFEEKKAKPSEPMGRFAHVIDLHMKKKASQ